MSNMSRKSVAKVKDHPDLRKVDGFAVVNTNTDEWRRAVQRQNAAQENKRLRTRVADLERKLDAVLNYIEEQKNAKS